MSKILVPVDFSEHSSYALEVAASLAALDQSEIVVLHMMGLSEAVLTKDPSQEAAEAHYYMKLTSKKFRDFLNKPFLKGIKVSELVQNYKIFSEVNEVAHEINAKIIVMGSHGTSGISGIFVGSNTEKVVRASKVPVLVIKVQRPDYKPSNVVFACDYNVENIKAYTKTLELCAHWKAQVHVVYVNLPTEKFKSTGEIRKAQELFFKVAHHGDIPATVTLEEVSAYSVEGGLFQYAEEINADLIALPTHGRKGLSHFFKGSIGEDVANHANIPVMTLRV